MNKGIALLKTLREKVVACKFDAYLVLHMDAHQSEYLAPCDERIAFISGFTGSNGLCLTTADKALMWTDGRYYLQAEKQLYDGWQMMKLEPGHPQYFEWIVQNVPKGSIVGVNETQMPAKDFQQKQKYFEKAGIQLVPAGKCLIDEVWADEKPSMPKEKVWVLDDKYTGQSVKDKYKQLAEKMGKDGNMLIISTLDDIAWLLNLRGNDISYNPLFFSYIIFYKDANSNYKVDLFIDKEKVPEQDNNEFLKSINVTLLPYEAVQDRIKELSAGDDKKMIVDGASCSYFLVNILKENGFTVIEQDKILQHIKASKNPVQQEGMRQCNIRDCAAIMKYFAFLETELKKPDHGIDEFTGARKVEEFRTHAGDEIYKGPSFDTISSIGPNGAVIHYKPEKDTALKLNNDEIYLLDSGGQYLDGTTDITRTAHFGGKDPTAFQKEAYTRVLMGNLELERVVWPSDSTFAGQDFDILARKYLFEAGLDYKHGTGHGVGSLLCVHEGPIGISRRANVRLNEGMCVSDEPGYYQDGEFGIRIENVIMVQKHPKFNNRYFFENLTTAPYCRELIDTSIMEQGMIDYVNTFHQKCLEKLSPLLQDTPEALAYVQRQCAPLTK